MAAWSPAELERWMVGIEARRGQVTHFEVLQLGRDADDAAVRAAFHRVAAAAHPDVHRRHLGPADYERLVRAYSLITLAYMTLRAPAARERYLATLPAAPSAPGASPAGAATADGRKPTPAPGRLPTNPARAQLYARKGETAWRAGDLHTALFNFKLALVADPTAQAVRAAMVQVEAELKAKSG